MPTFTIETFIDAPAEVCFDLMRDVTVHIETTSQTDERAVAGVTRGVMELGQTVTFEGRHFGIRQRLTVAVTEFERPRLFVDEMTEGVFESFKHVHEFTDGGGGTLMRDTLIWSTPFGMLGRIADRFFVERHLRDLVATRNARLKQIAESRVSELRS